MTEAKQSKNLTNMPGRVQGKRQLLEHIFRCIALLNLPMP